MRGGAFNNNARNLRSANRNRNQPTNHNNNIGFRLVVSTFFMRRKCPSGQRALAGRGEERRGLFLAEPAAWFGRITTVPRPGSPGAGPRLVNGPLDDTVGLRKAVLSRVTFSKGLGPTVR